MFIVHVFEFELRVNENVIGKTPQLISNLKRVLIALSRGGRGRLGGRRTPTRPTADVSTAQRPGHAPAAPARSTYATRYASTGGRNGPIPARRGMSRALL
ncbi:unnamed protein product, partial [Iphiclides podalirius]